MSSISNIRAITKRELAGYFSSPVAYVFIVIFLLQVITLATNFICSNSKKLWTSTTTPWGDCDGLPRRKISRITLTCPRQSFRCR